MTKIVSFYELCRVDDAAGILGIAKDKIDGNVIITIGQHMVLIMDIKASKQTHSWTVLDKLSSKVVYDIESDQYVAASFNFLRLWNENENNVSGKKKTKLQNTVQELVSNDDCPTIILYTDGSCEYLANAINSRKHQKNSKTTPFHISDARHFKSSSGENYLTYFTKSEEQNMVLVVMCLDKDTGKPTDNVKRFVLDRHDNNISPVGQTIFKKGDNISLLTLWSDRRIFSMPVLDNQDESPGSFISMTDLLNTQSHVSMVGISRNCVAIYGSNKTSEGACLFLYNTEFRVIHAKQYFKVFFENTKLWSLGNYIFIIMGQSLYIVSFVVSKELLSELIGSQRSSAHTRVTGMEFLDEDTELQEVFSFHDHKLEHSYIRSDLKNDLLTADGIRIPVNLHYSGNNMHPKIVMNATVSNAANLQLYLNANRNDDIIRKRELDHFDNILEHSGTSEQEKTGKILAVCLKAQLFKYMTKCMRKHPNISHEMQIKLLKYACTLAKDEFAHCPNNTEKSSTGDTEQNNTWLLNMIIHSFINSPTIIFTIKEVLNLEDALILLRYILVTNRANDKQLGVESTNFLENKQALMWFDVIITAYSQEMMMLHDKVLFETLMDYNEMFQCLKSELRCLQTTHALLSSLFRKQSSNTPYHNCKWYSIEKINLF